MMPTTVHPALLAKRASQQQPREYNLNKHPLHPKRYITMDSHMLQWKDSPAYSILINFILKLNQCATGKAVHDEQWPTNPLLQRALALLDQVQHYLDMYPCESDSSLSRFGNIAFRKFYDHLDANIDKLVADMLAPCEQAPWVHKELAWYFKESWGNRTRIDFGTGHELSFCAFMCCLMRCNLVTDQHCEALLFLLYNKYLTVVRNVQRKYNLEPAGSRGVWGLDDYFFLVYVWGSAQLVEHDHIRPADIHKDSILQAHKNDYFYLGAIAYIKEVKKGPFGEHSPLLNDISSVPTWKKTNSGMLKMFQAEVLDKLVVVQHLCFGKLLPWRESSEDKSQGDESDNGDK